MLKRFRHTDKRGNLHFGVITIYAKVDERGKREWVFPGGFRTNNYELALKLAQKLNRIAGKQDDQDKH